MEPTAPSYGPLHPPVDAPPDRLAATLALFAGLVVLVAVFWAGIGAALRAGGSGQPRAICVLRRLASVWLAAISVILIAKGVGA